MKTKDIKIIVSIAIATLLMMSYAFAYVPFEYNIIPMTKNESIVDTASTPSLSFKLFESVDNIFFEGRKVEVTDNSFSVDVSSKAGAQKIEFTNDNNEVSSFNYYFSDKNGKVNDYELVKGKKLNVFVTTYNNVQIVYTDKEKKALVKLTKLLEVLPKEMIENVKEIKMVPFSNTSNIAGTSKNNSIILYNFGKYSETTKKNIIYHEIAHIWANSLMDRKVIDYDYSDYKEVVAKDKNFVSTYAKNFAHSNDGRVSEDFADSVAFFFINEKTFSKKYANRAAYISNLLNE